MKFDPTLVVSPPQHQGSVLGRIVTEQSCLEILNEVQLASVRAELAALRAAQPVCDYLSLQRHRRALNNWCPTCKEYVAMSHDGPQGIACEKYIARRAQHDGVHNAEIRYEQCKKSLLAKNLAEREEARRFHRSAAKWWVFCVAFEFHQLCSAKLRELMAEKLVNTVPADDLQSLIASAEERSLLTKPIAKAFERFYSAENTNERKRHYVRHGAADLSFVRKQDLELATDF